MKKNVFASVVVFLSLVMITRPSWAGDERESYSGESYSGAVEVGLFGGVHFFNKNNELGVNDARNASHLKNFAIGGARIAIAIVGGLDIEAEFGVTPTKSTRLDERVLVLDGRGHLLYNFARGRGFQPFILAGAGAHIARSEDDNEIRDDVDVVAYGGLGAKIPFGHSWGARLDGRWLMPPSSASDSLTSDFEALLGLYKIFGGPDEVVDHDGDGINDDVDQCADEPEDVDDFEDGDGCPDHDNDGDGVPDGGDRCPAEAEDKDGFEDDDGCPDNDNDGDGLADGVDQCPVEAEDKDDFEDDDGCPDNDNDGDGVPDADDKCPGEAETRNGFEDDDGCPDQLPDRIKKFTGVIEGIKFANGKAVIRSVSFRLLDEAVGVLKEFPDINLLIVGHTDSVGGADTNQALSEARANSVRLYFVDKGIATERLTSVGKGSDEPLASNKTAAGRAQNRRVEFKIVSGEASKTIKVPVDPKADASPDAEETSP